MADNALFSAMEANPNFMNEAGKIAKGATSHELTSGAYGNGLGGTSEEAPGNATNKRKGGKITASSRADGIAQRGKTRGKLI